ncbi:hypothetical protein [Mannheimia pernigra]|uniref:hypothetical protein n=1 Tax=Mannheimia pernigra TaxID=111844 RepID=UPI00159F5699|nr:hypothetical protein [Mannheimia pernigra]QLB43273.1 hypothetical protein HV561_00015 [Mannheimia pernigra]
MQHSYTAARRPSWRGILAGLVMGLVVSMVMFALALVVGSFLSLDLSGAGIAAGVYAVITALISAFVAGYFAVKASAPEALFGDGTDILPKDAVLTGILTAATIIVITTFSTMNGLGNVARTAGSAINSTASVTTSVISSSSIGSIISEELEEASAGESGNVINIIANKAQELYQQVTGNISLEDIEQWVAKNNDTFSKEQISASANVVEKMVNTTKNEIKNMDFTSIETWKNLDDYAKKRAAEIENALTGDKIIVQLKNEGLSEAEAQQIRNEAVSAYQEYKAKIEQAVADAKAKAEQALATAEEAARKAALYSGLFWLISTLLTFVACVLGAKKAAANYRLARPLAH